MSSFDKEATRQQFEAMIGGIEFPDVATDVTDMDMVLAGGEPVVLDVLAGEVLRTELLAATSEAEAILAAGASDKHQSEPRHLRFISQALGETVNDFLERNKVTGQLALKGINTFLSPDDHTEVGPDRKVVCTRQLLQSDELLLGNIYGVMYGKFRWAKPKAIRKALASGEPPKYTKAWGGLLQLKDVRVCDTEGIGQVDRSFPDAFVPVHRKAFQWFLEAK